MELTNEQRKHFGLELIDPSWERMEIPANSVHPELSKNKVILYFDGDILRKEISEHDNGGFRENSYYLKTQDNRTKIAPITSKGKPKLLNGVNIQRCKPYGVYMDLYIKPSEPVNFIIGNYDTQKTYYSTGRAGVKLSADEFMDKWISETTEQDFKDLERFATEKRKHCKFKEGDFFRFKYDRRHYGYGRVLMDVYKWVKEGNPFWNILMGRPVCVSIYHIVTEDPDVSIDELSKLKSCPSQYIMDNQLYYGDYEVIGNTPLPEKVDYPIMYGRSISALNPDIIICCIGKAFYREIPLKGNYNPGRKFKNGSSAFSPYLNMSIVEECVKAGSNDPVWQSWKHSYLEDDIRAPWNKDELIKMKKQMRLD